MVSISIVLKLYLIIVIFQVFEIVQDKLSVIENSEFCMKLQLLMNMVKHVKICHNSLMWYTLTSLTDIYSMKMILNLVFVALA